MDWLHVLYTYHWDLRRGKIAKHFKGIRRWDVSGVMNVTFGHANRGTLSSFSTMSTQAELDAQRIYAPNVKHNSSLANVKFIATCFAGAAAGILGLEKWAGFAMFGAATLFTTACIFLVNCKGRPDLYLVGGTLELLNPGQENVMTFLLVWTLLYGTSLIFLSPWWCLSYTPGIVHVYD